MKLIVLLGRILFSSIFISGGLKHLSDPGMVGYAASAGVPMAGVLVPLSGLLALAGGLSILFGVKAKWGAWAIVAFLIPVTFTMHAFWMVSDPQTRMLQTAMFSKNLSMLGGAFLIAYFGSGPLSMEKTGPMEGQAAPLRRPELRKAA